MEAVRFGRGTWIGKMSTCWGQFGWKADNMEVLKELSTVEVREMLEAIAWRKVHEEWGQVDTPPLFSCSLALPISWGLQTHRWVISDSTRELSGMVEAAVPH